MCRAPVHVEMRASLDPKAGAQVSVRFDPAESSRPMAPTS